MSPRRARRRRPAGGSRPAAADAVPAPHVRGRRHRFHAPIRVGDRACGARPSSPTSRCAKAAPARSSSSRRRAASLRRAARRHRPAAHGVSRGSAGRRKSATPKRDDAAGRSAVAAHRHGRSVSLFRYSALTFNPHRIHYDRGYATRWKAIRGSSCTAPIRSNACSTSRATHAGPAACHFTSAPARRCSTRRRSRSSAGPPARSHASYGRSRPRAPSRRPPPRRSRDYSAAAACCAQVSAKPS